MRETMSDNIYENQGERVCYAEKNGLAAWLTEHHGLTIRDILDVKMFDRTKQILDEFEKVHP